MSEVVSCKIIKDSIYADNRLTTLELEYPRYIHSDFMTHRVFSRNAQSSRAVPVQKQISRVMEGKWFPIFMKNQPGMQADIYLEGDELKAAELEWQSAKFNALRHADRLNAMGIHKQIVNRVLEPYSKIKVIVSATDWDNFFSLRIAPDAQQEIQELAIAMKNAINSSKPMKLDVGQWHLPYIREDEEGWSVSMLKQLSSARCARVSYLNHDGKRDNVKDVELFYQLVKSRHMSPFEHVATPCSTDTQTSNFTGWTQLRYYIERINDYN